jgi:hypothetical protein
MKDNDLKSRRAASLHTPTNLSSNATTLDAVVVHRGNGVHHRPRQRFQRIGVHMGVDNVRRLAPASRRCNSHQNARHPFAPNESDQTVPRRRRPRRAEV